MPKIKCVVTLSGKPEKYISAIRVVRQYTSLDLRKARDKVVCLSSVPSITVTTETKKNALALVKELSDTGVKASWKKSE